MVGVTLWPASCKKRFLGEVLTWELRAGRFRPAEAQRIAAVVALFTDIMLRGKCIDKQVGGAARAHFSIADLNLRHEITFDQAVLLRGAKGLGRELLVADIGAACATRLRTGHLLRLRRTSGYRCSGGRLLLRNWKLRRLWTPT